MKSITFKQNNYTMRRSILLVLSVLILTQCKEGSKGGIFPTGHAEGISIGTTKQIIYDHEQNTILAVVDLPDLPYYRSYY